MKKSDSETVPPKARGSAEPEDIPTLEEVEEELGFNEMDFFASMAGPEPEPGEGRWEMLRRLRDEDLAARSSGSAGS